MRQSSLFIASIAARAPASALPFTSTTMGTATRSFSQRSTRFAELGVRSSNENSIHSCGSAAVGFTVTRSTSFSGLYSYAPHRSFSELITTIHSSLPGIVKSA